MNTRVDATANPAPNRSDAALTRPAPTSHSEILPLQRADDDDLISSESSGEEAESDVGSRRGGIVAASSAASDSQGSKKR